MNRIVYDGASQYGRYRIIDRVHNGRESRLLISGSSAPQSGMAFDNDPELLFDYNQRLFEVVLSLQPQSILAIGGGAFTLQRAIIERLPSVQVDTVELDPLLPKLARKYFGLRRNRRLSIITQDGREYINSCKATYDLIIVDAFHGYEVPRSLITTEAAARYADLLSPGGSLVLNVITKYTGAMPTLAHRLIATLRPHFRAIELYPADPSDNQRSEQNLIFVASLDPSPSLDYLQSVRVYPQVFDDTQLQMHD